MMSIWVTRASVVAGGWLAGTLPGKGPRGLGQALQKQTTLPAMLRKRVSHA